MYILPEHAMFGLVLCADVVCRFAAGSASCEGRASETPHYRCLYSRLLLLPSSFVPPVRLTFHAVLTEMSCRIARLRVLDRWKMQKMAGQSPHLTAKYKRPQQRAKMKRSKQYTLDGEHEAAESLAVGSSPILVRASLNAASDEGAQWIHLHGNRGASLVSYTFMAFVIKILPFSPSSISPLAFLLALSRSTAVYQRQHWFTRFQLDHHRVYPP
jgi:hypothetical protein